MIEVAVEGTNTVLLALTSEDAQTVANEYGRRVKLFQDRHYLGDLVPECCYVDIGFRSETNH